MRWIDSVTVQKDFIGLMNFSERTVIRKLPSTFIYISAREKTKRIERTSNFSRAILGCTCW